MRRAHSALRTRHSPARRVLRRAQTPMAAAPFSRPRRWSTSSRDYHRSSALRTWRPWLRCNLFLHGAFIVLGALPLQYFCPASRLSLVRALLEPVTAPFAPVTFWHVIVADYLRSLAKAFSDLQLTLCISSHIFSAPPDASGHYLRSTALWEEHHDHCADSVANAVMLALPFWWRLMQCLRVYSATRECAGRPRRAHAACARAACARAACACAACACAACARAACAARGEASPRLLRTRRASFAPHPRTLARSAASAHAGPPPPPQRATPCPLPDPQAKEPVECAQIFDRLPARLCARTPAPARGPCMHAARARQPAPNIARVPASDRKVPYAAGPGATSCQRRVRKERREYVCERGRDRRLSPHRLRARCAASRQIAASSCGGARPRRCTTARLCSRPSCSRVIASCWDIHMDRAPPRPGRGSHRVPRARVVRASAPTRWRALPITLARGALARGLSWLAGGLLRRRRLTLTMTRIWSGASPLQS